MRKLLIHTIPSFRKLFLAIALIVAYPCFAQEPEPVVDTTEVITVEEVVPVQEAEDSFYTPEKETENYFDEINRGDAYTLKKRVIADSVLLNLRKDKDFWYANEAPVRKAPPPSFRISDGVRALIRIVIIFSFIAILIWFLIASDVRLFRKRSSVYSLSEEGPLPDDIFSIDFEREMEKAIGAKDYRLAVRLMYLLILRIMAEKNIIRYTAEKTNSEYLVHLGNSSYYKNFFRLTRDFEYAWYGKFEISEPAFERIQQNFLTLKTSLHG